MSICTLVRKQLKVKGRTQHNGRGNYVMEVGDIGWVELSKRVDEGVKKWTEQGLIEFDKVDMEWDVEWRRIRFKDEGFVFKRRSVD